jgi:sugar phosphate isomerase/epimerase
MKTGIQVSSVKPLLKTTEQVRIAFSRMAALDCRYVQLQWIDPAVPISDISAALAENGIQSLSVQDFYNIVRNDLEYYVNLNAATGGIWLTVSRIPERCKSPEGLDLFIGELRDLQEILKPLGQRVCLHPVTADFTAVTGMNAVEYILDRMPELEICLDLFHLNRNCADMPGFIRRYAGRIPMVHFKDADPQGKLVPAGSGTVNYAGVVDACRDAGVEYGFAEQETWEGDPYECLNQALSWLNEELET